MTMLLAATLGLPLLMLAGCLSPALRRVLPSWLWLAPLPGVALALTGTLDKDTTLCRIVFRLDTAGALLLAAASVLWVLVGAAVPGWLRGRKDAGRFVPCWLATLTGNLGVFLTTDLIGFLIFYALVSLPAYGLIVFEGDPAARKAGNLYLGFAILGENLLLPAFVLLGLGVSPSAPGVLALVLLGFGMKIALLPLHFWMPPAYTAAPIPAAAVLSGAGVKAGVIGFLRFLPLDAGLSLQDWGLVLTGIGFCGAFYGVGIGLTQKSPKTILAYSSVSQMGFLAALLGVGLSCGEVAIAPFVAFYAAHHALAKGALFLAVGAPRTRRWLVLGPATLLGLGLAGLPLTGGALAKLAVKSPLGQGPLAVLASLSAIGTAILMLHFVFRLAAPGRGKAAPPSGRIALPVWLAGVAACLIFPWLSFSGAGLTLDEILSPAALWKTAWPVGLGVMLALGLRRLRIPEIPAGDILAPLAKCAPLPRGIAEILAAINALLRRWPVACASVVLLILALFLAGLIRPLSFDDLVSSPAPASGYEEALTKFAVLRAAEQALPLSESGHSILLTHGHPTERVFVLLHGYTNAPRQFQQLGESLFDAGANVVIPRLPHHGYADRLTDAHADLTAHALVTHAEAGLDIARGLGRRIALVGLSVSGVTAGWLIHKRNDIDEAWLLAPFFGPFVVPDRLTPPVTATLLRLPNFFQWWDPSKRENLPGPPMNYPRFSSHALGEAMRLGLDAERQPGPVRVRRVGLILSAADIAVSNRRALRIFEKWEAASPGVEFFTYTFPAAEHIPHDFIDPLQPDQQIERVYPMLLKWLLGSSTAEPSAAP